MPRVDITPVCYKAFYSMSTITTELKATRNDAASKYVMPKKKIQNILTSTFQVELINHNRVFKNFRDCDKGLLCECLLSYMHHSTKVPVSNHKAILDFVPCIRLRVGANHFPC